MEGFNIGFKVRTAVHTTSEILKTIKNIWWPMPKDEPDLLERIEVGLEAGRIEVGDHNLRPGPITKELIGRFWSGAIEWRDGEKGIAEVHKERLGTIWNLDGTDVKMIILSEWNCLEESIEELLIQHDTLREGMLFEDWEAVRKEQLPRVTANVIDNQEHPLFLSMNASREIIARQITEQLGHTVEVEDIRNADMSPWEGQWVEYQKLYIDGFWRWSENKKDERFNVSIRNTRRDVIEQLRRLGLDPTNYESLEGHVDGVILKVRKGPPAESDDWNDSEGDMVEVAMKEKPLGKRRRSLDGERDPERPDYGPFTHSPKRGDSPNAFVIVRGTMWPSWDIAADLFEMAEMNGGGSKGRLISERFKGNESHEIVTKGPLRVEGTWNWIELRDWLPGLKYVPNAFSVKIGDKRITHNGPNPRTKDEAEGTFWEETGLKPEEWKLVWTRHDHLTGRLMRKTKKECGVERANGILRVETKHPSTSQHEDRPPASDQSEEEITKATPLILPQEIITPATGTLRSYFAKTIGFPLANIKLWHEGEKLKKSNVAQGLRVMVEYIPRTSTQIKFLRIVWPENMEVWVIKKSKLLLQLDSISEKKGYAKIDGEFQKENGELITKWPQEGIIYWRKKERPRAMGYGGKGPCKGLPMPRQEMVRNIKCGEDPTVMMTEKEARTWLEENSRWIIYRNGGTWDEKTVNPGE
jgi:hypothetical protein